MLAVASLLPVFLWACQLTGVKSHGYVEKVVYQGEETTMYLPYSDPGNDFPDRAARAFNDNGPILDVSSDDIRCNAFDDGDDQPAKDVVSVQAGEDILLKWTEWPEPHMGPIMTYMAHCDNDDCTTFEPGRDAVWFKVHENGYDRSKYDASGETAEDKSAQCWGATAMPDLTDYTFQIPSELRAGQYLIRHEIIALHFAAGVRLSTNPDDEKGAQHYMQCIQFDVQSDGEAFPSEDELVAFPGAYSGDEPGLTLDIWDMPVENYTVPGPAVWSPTASSSTNEVAQSAEEAPQPSATGDETAAPEDGSKDASTSASASGGSGDESDDGEDDSAGSSWAPWKNSGNHKACNGRHQKRNGKLRL